jgi:hypothetical protein
MSRKNRRFIRKVKLNELVTQSKGLSVERLENDSFITEIINTDRLLLIQNNLSPFMRKAKEGEFSKSFIQVPENIYAVFVFLFDENGVKVNRRIPLTYEESEILKTKESPEELKEVLEAKSATLDILI